MTTRSLVERLTLVFVVVCAATGLVEAAVRDEPGLAVLCGLVLVGVISLGARLWRSKAVVEVRGDLHDWLETMATVRGESSSEVADRAISSYRASLDE